METKKLNVLDYFNFENKNYIPKKSGHPMYLIQTENINNAQNQLNNFQKYMKR